MVLGGGQSMKQTRPLRQKWLNGFPWCHLVYSATEKYVNSQYVKIKVNRLLTYFDQVELPGSNFRRG